MDTARASSTAGSSSQALCLYLRHTQEVDGRSRLICIITSSLISGSLVSPQQWLLAFGIFVHFLSSFWYFQAGKETETSPSDIPDRFRCAAFRSIASLSSFSLPAPRAGGNTAHQRDRISASQRCLYLAISLSHGWCWGSLASSKPVSSPGAALAAAARPLAGTGPARPCSATDT